MPKALLVIDVQEEWRDPNSPLYLGDDFKDLVMNINDLVLFSRQHSIPVIWVKHVLKADGSDRERFQPEDVSYMVEGTKGAELMSELRPLTSEVVLQKNKFSCFLGTNLEELLKKMHIDELILCGIMTNTCVRTTAFDGYQRSYKITIIRDACASDSKETDEFTFKDIQNLMFNSECVSVADFKKSG
ncbi:MAG: isochorismatase family cysteine hydrolase [Nanoarchaeota archaeon]